MSNEGKQDISATARSSTSAEVAEAIPDLGSQAKTADLQPPSPEKWLRLDTTKGSLIHRLIGSGNSEGTFPVGRVYVVTALITYGALSLAALASHPPIATSTGSLKLPFLLDWNFAFLCLVSLPVLVVLTLSDQHSLATALRLVQRDGIVTVLAPANDLAKRWENRFRSFNVIAHVGGAAIGLLLAEINLRTYKPEKVGYWIALHGRLVPAGYVFLVFIFVFYTLIPIYVVRNCTTSLFLRDLVRNARVNMLPLHPDKCGGLKPVGRLGLRNQYALSVFGVNVALLIFVSWVFLKTLPSSLIGLIAAATVAYVVLGPIVFMGPLLPFRAGMLKTKSELMGEVARRMRVELHRIRSQLADGQISAEDEQLIDRLKKIGGVIDELPVWPFDAGTLRRFLTAYVVPLIGAVGGAVLSAVIGNVLKP